MALRKITRRGVLQAAGVVGASVGVPSLWLKKAWGSQSPNEGLGILAIGVGGRGSEIARQAGRFGKIVACADPDQSNAQRFAKSIGGECAIYKDYREALERSDVDVITCGTPDHWHTKICIDALKAGKHVYCEKPLTLTMEESWLICRAVEQTGKIFQVGTQQRSEYNAMFLKAVVMARSGRLGKPLHALSSVGQATSGGPFPTQDPPPHLDWNLWLGQAPYVPFCPNRIGWNFRWWFEYSGGQVTDWGVHHTDIALWALGGEDTGVIEATPIEWDFPIGQELIRDTLLGRKPFEELPVAYNVAKTFKVDLKLPNGNVITLYSGPNELIITGSEGRIRVNRGSLTGKPIEELSEADRKWLDEEVIKLYKGKEPGSHMRNFFECIRDNTQPISDVWTHCNSVNACHIANIAMLLGRTVRFDPKEYRFIDDEEANILMRRKQREPFQIVL